MGVHKNDVGKPVYEVTTKGFDSTEKLIWILLVLVLIKNQHAERREKQ